MKHTTAEICIILLVKIIFKSSSSSQLFLCKWLLSSEWRRRLDNAEDELRLHLWLQHNSLKLVRAILIIGSLCSDNILWSIKGPGSVSPCWTGQYGLCVIYEKGTRQVRLLQIALFSILCGLCNECPSSLRHFHRRVKFTSDMSTFDS